MKPNPHDMIIFLAVAEARSFTGAAQLLGVTKSAVSHAVNRLEADTGHQLLLRTTRSLSLTDAGSRLLPRCEQLRDLHTSTIDDMQALGGEVSETLTVTAPHALCQSAIIPALSDYKKQSPSLSIRLIADDNPVDLISKQIDIAIRVGALGPQTAMVTRIGTLKENLYASESYAKTIGDKPTNLSALAPHPHITNEWQGSPARYQSSTGETISVKPHIRCNSLHDLIDFTRRGFGIALIPEITVNTLDNAKDLTPLFELVSTPIYALHQYHAKPPKKVRDFIKSLREKLKPQE